jgi:4-amino-4-deoxy-L-arabinose transferase-like glycosyltransferase
MQHWNYKSSLKYFVIALLISVPIFGHLDTLPIRIWDESRLAVNAYEMQKDGDFIVTHFYGQPEMWNTKPPLMIWLQAFFMKTIGVGELAVRLPSALAAFFTSITLLVFFRRYISFWFGSISVMILVTSSGYIGLHASRTGDYDTVLTLFTTLYSLFFFAFCESKKTRFIYLFFLFCTLSVLTKGIAGFLLIPGIVLFSLIRNQFVSLFKNKHFYIGALSFLFVVVGYYLLREANNRGYLQSVYQNELGGRYLAANEGHNEDITYYFLNLVNYRFDYWHLLIPCGIVIGFTSLDSRIKKITTFSTLMAFTYFIIISSSKNRLEQYDMQLFPFLSIIVSVCIYYIFNALKQSNIGKQTLSINLLPFLFLFLVFVKPYQLIIEKTYKPKETKEWKEFYELSYFLKDATKGKYNLKNRLLLYDGYDAHITFYVDILNDKGINIARKNWEELESGDVVITHQYQIKEYLEKTYSCKLIESYGNVGIYQITTF